MSNLNDLELDSITNGNDIRIPFVIVFTHTDDYLAMFTKKAKVWKDFQKKYQTDRPKEGFHAIDDISIDKDDDEEPYRKKDVAIITKDSLSAISEVDKQAMTFGIRVVDEENKLARVFDEDMLKYFEEGGLSGQVNKDIDFDDVESTLNEVMEQTKQLNHVAKQKAANDESKNDTSQDQQNSEETKEEKSESVTIGDSNNDNYYNGDASSDEDTATQDDGKSDNDTKETSWSKPQNPTPSRKTKFTDDNMDNEDSETTQNRTPIQEMPSTSPEENSEILERNKHHEMILSDKQPETPLEFAQQDLLYEISKMIPRIDLPRDNYIPDDVLDSMSDSESYDEVKSIKRLTEDKLNKRAEHKEKYLNSIRNEEITRIYNNLNRRLNVENDELMRKSDFTSDYSPFNHHYVELKNEYQTVINSLSDTKYNEVEKNKQTHEREKQAYVDRAAKEAAETFDNNNLHLIEDNAQAYVDDIKNQADNQYNDNYNVLKKDSDNWYVQNFNTLVPKIVQGSKEDIESIAQSINQTFSENIKELNQQMETDLDYFADKLKQIKEKEIETNKNNEALINTRVHERTLEYPDMKHEIKDKSDEIERLKKELEKKHEESEENRKKYITESKRNEGLEESLANRDIDRNMARDDYLYLSKILTNGNVEKLQKIIDMDKATPVRETFLDKMKNYTNVIASAIIALAIIIGALLFNSGQSNENNGVSQSEVKTQVQQAVKDEKSANEKEQEKKDKEIEQLKKDVKDAKDKQEKKDK